MLKETAKNKTSILLLIVTLLSVILYCFLITSRFVYYWDVYLPTYRIAIYTLAITIPLGLIYIYVIPQNLKLARGIIMAITIPVYLFYSTIFLTAFPSIIETRIFGNHTYYLFKEDELFKPRTFMRLLICEEKSLICKQSSLEIVVDIPNRDYYLVPEYENNEIHLLTRSHATGNTWLLYSHGDSSRSYDYPEELDGYLYYLAKHYTSSGGIAFYTIYRCNPDSTSCNKLPFEYQGSGRIPKLEINDQTGVISLYSLEALDQYVLIFTWDEHPRCYVEGCEILEETK